MSITDKCVGQWMIVRSRNEGVNFGRIEEADETGVVVAEARRLWYHRPVDKSVSWYEGVALSGLSEESRISPPVRKVIIEEYSLTECTKDAIESIKNFKSHEQI